MLEVYQNGKEYCDGNCWYYWMIQKISVANI